MSPLFSINMWLSGNDLDGHYLTNSYLLVGLWRVAEDCDKAGDFGCPWTGHLPFQPRRPNFSLPEMQVWKRHRGKRMTLNSPSVARSSRVSCPREKGNSCSKNRQCCWELCRPRLPKGRTHKAGVGQRVRDRLLENQRLLSSSFLQYFPDAKLLIVTF